MLSKQTRTSLKRCCDFIDINIEPGYVELGCHNNQFDRAAEAAQALVALGLPIKICVTPTYVLSDD